MTIYSHSRLETFKNCPLKYKFNYIDKIKREEEGIEAFLGSRFHEVMEKIYKDLPFRKYSLDELLDFYEDDWDKNYHDKIVIADNERKAKDYKEIGKKFIEDYYKRYYPFNQGKVLGIERWVIINLDDKGEYKLRGIIDRLNQTKDGTYEIHDYKTSKSFPEQSKMDEDRQLALYQIGVQSMWNDVGNVELVWHYVAFDKEIRSKRREEELAELKKDTIEQIKKIEATREFLPNKSTLCGWCYYKNICPLHKHEYMVGNVPGKGTRERESLIELLSQLNRLEEVSAFDAAELKKVIKEEKWDSAILDEIKKFVEIKTVKSVSLFKLKSKTS